jgi:ATP synthase F0 subunit b
MNALLYIPPLAEGGGDVFGNLGINGVMLAAQIVNLIFLMLFLKPLLIDPLLKNLEARRKRIEDSLDNARKADERLANVEKDYAAKLEEAAAESQKARAEALRAAQVDADRVRADAVAEAEKIKAQGRVDASAERNQMLAGVRSQVAALAIGPLAGDLDLLFANGRRQHIPAAQIPTVNRYVQGKALGLLKEAEAAVVGAVVVL